MRFKPIIMIVLAVVFGGSAILVGNSWLSKQAAQQRAAAVPSTPIQPATPMSTIVVASSPLRYGDELTSMKLKQIPWPATALPAEAFSTVDEVTRGGKRVALAAMEPNEPVLRAKITGAGARATVSALLDDNMGAVTIQVDEVIGVAGLVLPGDRVDIFLTQKQSSEESSSPSAKTDRILQNIRVLAIGQTADQKLDKPSVVRAVTIEVTPIDAQKVALASRLGNLSLMLRKAGETVSYPTRRLTGNEVAGDAEAGNDDKDDGAVSVRVARGMKQTSYSVPKAAGAGQPAQPTHAAGAAHRALGGKEQVDERKREVLAQ